MPEQEKELVKIMQMGSNICVTLHKKALMEIKAGKSIPLHLTSGKATIKIVLMRDTTLKRQLERFKAQEQLKLNKKKESENGNSATG